MLRQTIVYRRKGTRRNSQSGSTLIDAARASSYDRGGGQTVGALACHALLVSVYRRIATVSQRSRAWSRGFLEYDNPTRRSTPPGATSCAIWRRPHSWSRWCVRPLR